MVAIVACVVLVVCISGCPGERRTTARSLPPDPALSRSDDGAGAPSAAPSSEGVPGALEPVPAPPVDASQRLYLRLGGAQGVRAAMDVPGAWGVKVGKNGDLELTSCRGGPLGKLSVFVAPAPCEDDVKRCIEADLKGRGLEGAKRHDHGPLKLTIVEKNAGKGGSWGSETLRVHGLVGDAATRTIAVCTTLVLEDHQQELAEAYRRACESLTLNPPDWREQSIASRSPRPDATEAPLGDSHKAAGEAILGFIAAAKRADRAAVARVLPDAKACAKRGGKAADRQRCLRYAEVLHGSIDELIALVPSGFEPGTIEHREQPKGAPGLFIVHSKTDPCDDGLSFIVTEEAGRSVLLFAVSADAMDKKPRDKKPTEKTPKPKAP
jgi:hypothetical protein